MSGKLIRLFLADGKASGMRTLEVSNMTIHGTVFPRTQLDKFVGRHTAQKPGVYLLLGKDTNNLDETVLYVGEGDPVGPRLRQHANSKDFWTEAMVFSSKDDYLTKTQIQYLESELVRLAKAAGRVNLENNQTPTLPNISEVDRSEVTQFLDAVLLIIAALGHDMFEPRAVSGDITSQSPIFELEVKGAHARMQIIDDRYVVLKGSTAVVDNRPSIMPSIIRLREDLLETGVVARSGQYLVFAQDAAFNSPSYAAAAIVGGAANGRADWKHKGRPLKAYQE